MDTQASRLITDLSEFVHRDDDPIDRLQQIRWVQWITREWLERECAVAVRALDDAGRLDSPRANRLIPALAMGVTSHAEPPPPGEWYDTGISGPPPL